MREENRGLGSRPSWAMVTGIVALLGILLLASVAAYFGWRGGFRRGAEPPSAAAETR